MEPTRDEKEVYFWKHMLDYIEQSIADMIVARDFAKRELDEWMKARDKEKK